MKTQMEAPLSTVRLSHLEITRQPPPTHTLRSHQEDRAHGSTPLPMLPPATERAEDGMPLGRSHHAERARAANAAHVPGTEGSNVRVDSRGVQVMRVLPLSNDDANEEWTNDKT